MLFELAYFAPDGTLVRGGVAATIRTVGRWIEEHSAVAPEIIFVAIPASEEAINVKTEKGRA